MTKLAEKDKNMSAENKRFWDEISSHNYDFNRQANELKALNEVTLDEFKSMFESVFFSAETRRLDLELTSAMHKEKQSEQLAENEKDPYFTAGHIKRVVHTGNITDFKEKASYMSDTHRKDFEKFRDGDVEKYQIAFS